MRTALCRRTELEDTLIDDAARVLPEDIEVTLLADRGFGDPCCPARGTGSDETP
jgi:hypothetical protein